MTKSGGQFALASPLQILGYSSPCPPVIYAHGCACMSVELLLIMTFDTAVHFDTVCRSPLKVKVIGVGSMSQMKKRW